MQADSWAGHDEDVADENGAEKDDFDDEDYDEDDVAEGAHTVVVVALLHRGEVGADSHRRQCHCGILGAENEDAACAAAVVVVLKEEADGGRARTIKSE